VRPFVIGALIMLCGYLWAGMSRKKRAVPDDLVRFLRKEQIGRLRACLDFRKGVPG
jgi:hypothetical protein